jgi:hypothetical protein
MIYKEQGRANRFQIGGCSPKCGPPSIPGPPKKKFSGKRQFFPESIGDDNIFSENKSSQNLSQNIFPEIFKIFSQCNSASAIPPRHGPLPASWAPLIYFFGGVLHPPTPPPPPRWHGPDKEKQINISL